MDSNAALVGVITYGDSNFAETLGQVLAGYNGVKVKYFDSCTPCHFQTGSYSVLLINADNIHMKENRMRELSSMTRDDAADGPVVIMLTTEMTASDFMRYQAYRVNDTIDIGENLGGLRAALNAFFTPNKQLPLFTGGEFLRRGKAN